MKTKELIKILRNIGTFLEILGENPFKTRAYSNAADIIEEGGIDIEGLARQGLLGDVKGFGKALSAKITEYVETGQLTYYQKLTQQIPESVLELTYIPGLGPKKIGMLYKELNIIDLDTLEKACNNGSILQLKGFTAKTAEDILTSIDFIRAFKGRSLGQGIIEAANALAVELAGCPGVLQLEYAGDLRRQAETIGDIILVISSDNPQAVQSCIGQVCSQAEPDGPAIAAVYRGIKIRIFITGPGEYALKLHELTGSESYVGKFAEYIGQKGYSIKVGMLSRNGEPIQISNEQELYNIAGMPYLMPILRDSPEIIARVQATGIPQLVERDDIRGVVHVHTTWSDGKHSVREMALHARSLGYEYIVITDHSKSSVVANGLKEDRIVLQHEEIDRLNAEGLGIHIFKGIECDILGDGSLDYSDDVLRRFDVVIASVHNNFRMKKEDMTRRMINALKNPYTTMLGHPTGRLLLARQAYEVDIKQIIDEASDFGKIIEINANPYRLDLSAENALYAAEKGVKMSINPDSHRKETITDIDFGITVAQKALLGSADIVNCLDSEDFRKQVCNK